MRFSWFNLFMLALASFGLALDLVWVAFWRALDLWFGLDLACKLNTWLAFGLWFDLSKLWRHV